MRLSLPIFRKARRTEVISSIVRPWESNVPSRREQITHAQLVARNVGWVYVAATRNSSDTASVPVRFYTRKGGPAKKHWGGRPLTRKKYAATAHYAGQTARKAFGSYDTDEVVEITDPSHPVNKLLARPNPWLSGFDFIDLAIRYCELTGNAYTVKANGGSLGYPTELWLVQSQNVYIIPSRTEFIAGYVYGRGTETERTYKREEVAHLKYPNPHNPYYGMGPLAAATVEADTSRAITVHSQATLDNGAQPGLVIHGKNLTAKERTGIQAELDRRVEGPTKAAKSLVMSGDVTVVQWSMGAKELAYLESAKDVRDTIAAIFDISISDLTTEDVNRANAEAGSARQERRAVRPRARRFEDMLNQQVLPDFYEALGDDTIFVCFDPPEQEAAEAAEKRVVSLKQAGIITTNEARREMMYEDIEGGDTLDTGDAVGAGIGTEQPDGATEGQPEGTDAAASSEATPAASGSEGIVTEFRLSGIDAERAADLCAGISKGEQSPDVVTEILLAMGIPADGVNRMVSASVAFEPKEPEPVLAPGIPGASNPLNKPQKQPEGNTGADKGQKNAHAEWYWLRSDQHPEGIHTKDDDRTDANRAIERIIVEWYGAVIAATQEGEFNALNLAGIKERMQARMREVLGSILQAGASAVGASFDVPPADALKFLDDYTLRLTGDIAASTEEAIRVQVRDGLAAGNTTEEIRREIASTLRGESPFRAERIARTETAHALNQGRLAGWKDLGYTGKEWVLSVNPCEICEAIAAKFNEPIALGQPFLKMGESIEYGDGTTGKGQYTAAWGNVDVPPLHPQCRCDIKGTP